MYNPSTGKFIPWNSFRINVKGKELPCVAYGQRVDLPNGDILLPFSMIKELDGWNSFYWCGTARCRLNNERITVIETGNLVTNSVSRGFVEPSITENNGIYYMTLRAQDGYGYVATSIDGLNWEVPKPWKWDNGETIEMDQTMTKFISRSDGLFLIYTKITEDNKSVFRHRAPLFIAQIDTKKACLIQKTESIILRNKGFPLGNFNIYNITPNETWVTSQEWDRTGQEIGCNNVLGRIVWESPNKSLIE